MTVQILSFGKVKELVNDGVLELEEATDTDKFNQLLQARYPALKGMKYAIAVNQKMVTENTALPAGATVALLPPFSGG